METMQCHFSQADVPEGASTSVSAAGESTVLSVTGDASLPSASVDAKLPPIPGDTVASSVGPPEMSVPSVSGSVSLPSDACLPAGAAGITPPSVTADVSGELFVCSASSAPVYLPCQSIEGISKMLILLFCHRDLSVFDSGPSVPLEELKGSVGTAVEGITTKPVAEMEVNVDVPSLGGEGKMIEVRFRQSSFRFGLGS